MHVNFGIVGQTGGSQRYVRAIKDQGTGLVVHEDTTPSHGHFRDTAPKSMAKLCA